MLQHKIFNLVVSVLEPLYYILQVHQFKTYISNQKSWYFLVFVSVLSYVKWVWKKPRVFSFAMTLGFAVQIRKETN